MRSFLVILAAWAIGGCARGGSGRPADAGGRGDASGLRDAPPIFETCGNGAIDAPEECDRDDHAGQDCVSLGYAGGLLSCADDCTFDKSLCDDRACGNGVLDAPEECDGASLGAHTCASEGFVSGAIACRSDCRLDVSGCRTCGDGSIDTGEECDGTDLGGARCADRGFTGGTLSCDPSCGLEDSMCLDAACGDGVRSGSEPCDGGDLGGQTCASAGFFGGTLSCNADCTLRIANCHSCGNGSIEGIEQCDGADLAGADCTTRGFTMGTLRCSPTCAYDTSMCATAACGDGSVAPAEACDDMNAAAGDGCSGCMLEPGYSCTGAPSRCRPICGDGMIRGFEQCDGTNLGTETCASRGFIGGGTLRCSASCAFDTTMCSAASCGNSIIDAGEECDDGNTVAFDGCNTSCQVDANYHLPVRLRNGEGSNHGMLEVWFSGAWREVCDDTYLAAQQQAMANVVCRQLGFTGTGHRFLSAFGGGAGTPAMDDVQCTGSEPTLAQCPFGGWNVEDCSGAEAVGIRCMPGEGDIRLVGGPHGMEGRLQIFHGGGWGEVCDDYFDGGYGSSYYGYSTTTVCQQLGYRGGAFVSTYDAPSDTFLLDDVNCTGSERRIDACPHLAWGTENCFRFEGAGFRCDVHAEGDVRLLGGTGRNAGRIEILHENVWGTICDDALESPGPLQTGFVAVACGQLGFTPRSGSALVTTATVDGSDPISMDDVACSGTEGRLTSCSFRTPWRSHDCSHYEDIGLSCTP